MTGAGRSRGRADRWMLAATLLAGLLAGGCLRGMAGDGGGASEPGASNGSGSPGGGANPGNGSSGSGNGNGSNGGNSGPGNAGNNPLPSSPPGASDPGPLGDAGAPGGPGPVDSGTSGDSGAGMSPACQAQITAVWPSSRLDNLLAGPQARLRVRVDASGEQLPAQPAWSWRVSHGGAPLAHQAVGAGGEVIEFALAAAGIYTVTVSGGGSCSGSVNVDTSDPVQRKSDYLVRVTPGNLEVDGAYLPTQERFLRVGQKLPMAGDLALTGGSTVTIEPRDEQMESVRSFIRVSSPSSSVQFDGNNQLAGFRVDLNPAFAYDVLIVPDGPRAPLLLPARRADQLRATTFVVPEGFAVSGEVRAGAGEAPQPLAGARVFLRDQSLPSTIDTTDAGGRFDLRAGAGAYQAHVLPPLDSGLPEVRLPDADPARLSPPATFQLTYRVQPTARLEVQVSSPDGQRPIAGARVRIEADPATLADAATFTLQSPGLVSVKASASLRLEKNSAPSGNVVFPRLPPGRYRLLVHPPAGESAGAAVSRAIEVDGGAPVRVALATPVRLGGQLQPIGLTAGLEVVATEEGGPSPATALTATVAADGSFAFSAAPGRSYRLQVQPEPGRRMPRLFLGAVVAGTSDTTLPPITVSPGILYSGNVLYEGKRSAGSVIQVFCSGPAPDCVNLAAPNIGSARPVAEARAGSDGQYQLLLPDPAAWDR